MKNVMRCFAVLGHIHQKQTTDYGYHVYSIPVLRNGLWFTDVVDWQFNIEPCFVITVFSRINTGKNKQRLIVSIF